MGYGLVRESYCNRAKFLISKHVGLVGKELGTWWLVRLNLRVPQRLTPLFWSTVACFWGIEQTRFKRSLERFLAHFFRLGRYEGDSDMGVS